MASDEEYASFLERANQETREPSAQDHKHAGAGMQLKALDEGAQVPEVLSVPTSKEEWIYVSDADEPFVPVCLGLKDGGVELPDEEIFAKTIGHPAPTKANIEILTVEDWDRAGRYADVVGAVREAVRGADVVVYKVDLGGVRMEYWVVGCLEGRLVGVKALSVES